MGTDREIKHEIEIAQQISSYIQKPYNHISQDPKIAAEQHAYIATYLPTTIGSIATPDPNDKHKSEGFILSKVQENLRNPTQGSVISVDDTEALEGTHLDLKLINDLQESQKTTEKFIRLFTSYIEKEKSLNQDSQIQEHNKQALLMEHAFASLPVSVFKSPSKHSETISHKNIFDFFEITDYQKIKYSDLIKKIKEKIISIYSEEISEKDIDKIHEKRYYLVKSSLEILFQVINNPLTICSDCSNEEISAATPQEIQKTVLMFQKESDKEKNIFPDDTTDDLLKYKGEVYKNLQTISKILQKESLQDHSLKEIRFKIISLDIEVFKKINNTSENYSDNLKTTIQSITDNFSEIVSTLKQKGCIKPKINSLIVKFLNLMARIIDFVFGTDVQMKSKLQTSLIKTQKLLEELPQLIPNTFSTYQAIQATTPSLNNQHIQNEYNVYLNGDSLNEGDPLGDEADLGNEGAPPLEDNEDDSVNDQGSPRKKNDNHMRSRN